MGRVILPPDSGFAGDIGGVIAGIAVPREAATTATLASLSPGILVEQERKRRSLPDPLPGRFAPAKLAPSGKHADRRFIRRIATQAVRHAQIDQIASLRPGRDAQTREEVLRRIAGGVIRAGIRREDSCARIEGDAFTIVIQGADERAAIGVAERLRRALARFRLPRPGTNNPFTTSFGVAAGRVNDSRDNLVSRARA
ncbi:GGDEF domain-containing protein [Erythrobacter tepidarius]|uniref:GGDEF domain-containing protein n=1 Tax=Erythrobacter tepidarius TaxID=60454 RepID=UPI001302A8C8|nr:diguanylate cyclase [Erythrobacter tepidarius]